MKREPVFVKPTYKYKGEVKEHPIERLEFIYVPSNDIERLGINLKRVGKKLSEVFNGVDRRC